MSSYPPPPPYDPRQDARAARDAARAQQRAMRDQIKFQRAALRVQTRARRRRSILGPLFLVALGVLFLLAQLGRLPWIATFDWFARWWPAVLIIAGAILLLEWFLDHHRTDALTGRPLPTRSLGFGVTFLLILIASVGVSSRFVADGLDWKNTTFGPDFHSFDHIFGERHDFDDTLSSPITPGETLTITNAHGDITLTGSSTDGQVHVAVHKQLYAWKQADINDRESRLQPVFSPASADSHNLSLTVPQVDGGQADLTIEVPRTTTLTLTTSHGDINITQMHAPLTVSINHGDIDLSAIDGPVTVHLNNNSGSLTARNLSGNLSAEGRGGDLEISDITGSVALDGDFFGTTHAEHIAGPFRFHSSRTQFDAARLDGSFETETGPDLTASDLLGPVILTTRNRNITLDRVQGSVQVTNRNGSVNVDTAASPGIGLSPITIHNERGSVDLGLPGTTAFTVNASTRNGDLENDFNLTPTGDSTKTLHGAVSTGGPTVTIDTTDGDVTLRKTSLTPLPPTPPTPPRFTAVPVPAPPKPPAPPTSPALSKLSSHTKQTVTTGTTAIKTF